MQHFPINFETAEKGDIISVERIEEVMNVKRTDKSFPLKKMGLQSMIESGLRNAGKYYTIRSFSKGDCLRILTDEEASLYNNGRAKAAIRAHARSLDRLSHVDTSEFNDDVKRSHHNSLTVHGAIQSAIVTAKTKAYQAIQCERKTPGLPAGQKEV